MDCRLTGLVAGVDEAGRAPLAGSRRLLVRRLGRSAPVREKVNDSKLLSEKTRELLLRVDPGERVQGDGGAGKLGRDRRAQHP